MKIRNVKKLYSRKCIVRIKSGLLQIGSKPREDNWHIDKDRKYLVKGQKIIQK